LFIVLSQYFNNPLPSACTSDFPFGGNPEQTKTWLENKGFHGILPEWPADSILFLSASEIKDEVPGVDAEKLIGFINTARQALGEPCNCYLVYCFHSGLSFRSVKPSAQCSC
jgi:hypothetical protein